MTLQALLRITRLQTAVLPTLAASLALTSCQLPDQARQWLSDITSPRTVTGGDVNVRRTVASEEHRQLSASPVSLNLPTQSSAPFNDTARVLAGLPASGRDYFPEIRNNPSWANHKAKLDRLWADFGSRHEAPIRSWASSQIGDLQSSGALFYPFGGPDFLYANAFFPRTETIVLCGLESCEPLPSLSQLGAGEVSSSMDGLTTSIKTAMQFSFFITKDMRHDLVNTRFKGVLPLILTFMARSGQRVESVDFVRLDGNGQPVVASSGNGLLIRGYGPNGGAKRVFYFRQDLSDGGLSPGSPLLRFVSSLGRPPAFVKSASYLMHEEGFHNIRNYLINNCRGIVQDPSGVPYRNLVASGADVRLYGNYQGTLDMFRSHQQQDLINAYQQGQTQPLNFGIGYLYQPTRTSLMVARPGLHVSSR